MPGHAHVAAEDVGGHTETGHVADVARAVGVRPGDGGQHLAHGREPSCRGHVHRSTRVVSSASSSPKARRSSSVSSCGRENCTACSAIIDRCRCSANSSTVSGERRSGTTASLDVGVPGVVALRGAEHLAQVTLSRREGRGAPVEQPRPVGRAHQVRGVRRPVREHPPVDAAGDRGGEEGEASQRLPQDRSARRGPSDRPAPTTGRPPTPARRDSARDPLGVRTTAARSSDARRAADEGAAAGAAGRACMATSLRCASSTKRPLPSAPPSRYGVKVSSSPGARSTATRASRVGTGVTANDSLLPSSRAASNEASRVRRSSEVRTRSTVAYHCRPPSSPSAQCQP